MKKLIFIAMVASLFAGIKNDSIDVHLEINHAFTLISFLFSIYVLCILYIRTFIFRLNLELVELNHILIDSDKYFIFKYTLPNYIVIQIVSGFGFLIMIFK